MAKVISKSEAVKIINQLEPLEILHEALNRNDTSSFKQTRLAKFIQSIQNMIKDERDVVLIAIRVK